MAPPSRIKTCAISELAASASAQIQILASDSSSRHSHLRLALQLGPSQELRVDATMTVLADMAPRPSPAAGAYPTCARTPAASGIATCCSRRPRAGSHHLAVGLRVSSSADATSRGIVPDEDHVSLPRRHVGPAPIATRRPPPRARARRSRRRPPSRHVCPDLPDCPRSSRPVRPAAPRRARVDAKLGGHQRATLRRRPSA